MNMLKVIELRGGTRNPTASVHQRSEHGPAGADRDGRGVSAADEWRQLHSRPGKVAAKADAPGRVLLPDGGRSSRKWAVTRRPAPAVAGPAVQQPDAGKTTVRAAKRLVDWASSTRSRSIQHIGNVKRIKPGALIGGSVQRLAVRVDGEGAAAEAESQGHHVGRQDSGGILHDHDERQRRKSVRHDVHAARADSQKREAEPRRVRDRPAARTRAEANRRAS
ncbi:putative gp17 [Burkholderia multivorans]|uniref:Gp17 n=1 Tax=Burkholderia multivorans TaxID=87883 RepID=A0ABD7LH29_9BURK|nr:putative gp17 [Burkholderia multivorans]